MAQDQLVLRRIDWQEVFAFTRLFNGFRSALHSTKIVLALAGLFLTFAVGCTLDWVWNKAGKGVWPAEIRSYHTATGSKAFHEWADLEYQVQIALAAQPYDPAITPTWIRTHGVQAAFDDVRERLLKQTIQGDQRGRATALRQMAALQPVGPFIAFTNYERDLTQNLILSAGQLRIMEGLNEVVAARPMGAISPTGLERVGVLGSIVLMWSGLVWLLAEHWFFSLLFVPAALAIWAVAGGGISRAAVVQLAKDERIGIREALQFSLSKFWGFFFAPLVCLAFIVAIGLMLTVGGLVGSIPYIGDILIGVLWLLALLGGVAIAFITIGTLAGGSLFAPVIASEGSDAFDAISRGFSYVYGRPWKSLLYGLTLVIYGSLCYLFLRFFVWLTLAATHVFVGLGMLGSRDYAGVGADKLDVAWRMPTFLDLRPHGFDYYGVGMSGNEVLLALLIGVWTYLVWSLLQSWLISFYFSGSSMAYLLLRKDVDAVEVDEIYVEEEPEAEAGAGEPAAQAGGQSAPAAASPVQVVSAPPAEPPGGSGPSAA